jgi:hypothetical protein
MPIWRFIFFLRFLLNEFWQFKIDNFRGQFLSQLILILPYYHPKFKDIFNFSVIWGKFGVYHIPQSNHRLTLPVLLMMQSTIVWRNIWANNSANVGSQTIPNGKAD